MKNNIFIIISDAALMQISHATLEAFNIKHLVECESKHKKSQKKEVKKKKYLETYGLLWGSFTKIPQGDFTNLIYTISFVGIETSAERNTNEVTPNDDSFILKRDLMTSFWPQFKFLGDFHTHPYRRKQTDYKDIEDNKFYEFSQGDYSSIQNFPEYWSKYNYRIGIVVTIVDMKNKVKKIEQREDNLIIFNFGNYRMWIKGYWARFIKKNGEINKIKLTSDVFLRCPSLTGMKEFTPFGKHIRGFHEEGELGVLYE